MANFLVFLALIAFLAQHSSCFEEVQFQDAIPYNQPAEDSSSIRKKASVRPFAGNVRSYSGFLSVEPKYDAKLFYWFFEKDSNSVGAPILVWLYGEIGRSSMLSVFEENGPYFLKKDKVTLRENSWTKDFNVLYLDSTVATGYSSSNSSSAYPKTSQQAADYLYKALKEFANIFDNYKSSTYFLAGESHVAKIVVSLANKIIQENPNAKTQIQLQKVCLGAGFLDPVNQQRRAEFLYQVGVVDPVGKAEVNAHEDQAYKAMREGKHNKAKSVSNTINRKIKAAGYAPPIDAAEPKYDLSSFKATIKFFESQNTRQELHAGNSKFLDKPAPILKSINADLQKSSSQELVQVLQQCGVVMYTGQYDMVVPTSQYDSVVENLNWHYIMDFTQKPRVNWYLNGKLAGYFKWYKNLCQVMVRQANHYIARSQPYLTMKALQISG